MEQRPYRDLTIIQIEDRLRSIEQQVERLKNQFVTSDRATAASMELNKRLLPEFQRLGQDQVVLFQELALRRKEEGDI
jgi:hypothetical protein